MSKAIAVAKPSIESVGAESHQPSPHATKSRKQKLIDAPRQSNTSVKALANEAVTVNDHPTRPPRLILIVAPVSSRLSRDSHCPVCAGWPDGRTPLLGLCRTDPCSNFEE